MQPYGKNLDKVIALGFGGIVLIVGAQHLFVNGLKIVFVLVVTVFFQLISCVICKDIKRLELKLQLILFLGMLLIFSMSIGIGEMLQYLVELYF